jgi:protein gp37
VNVDERFNDLVVKSMNNQKGDNEKQKRFTGTVLFDPAHLYAVLRLCEPKKIFVNEFSDLFFEALPLELILEHFRVFNAAPWHQFQVLTKRSERLAEVNDAVLAEFGRWPANVWQGVSACSAAEIEMQRIDRLGKTAAAIRWISFEPWVSVVNRPLSESVPDLKERLIRNGIAWVVVGGESGSKDDTNLMTIEDARYLMTQAKAAGCRVQFKQLGTALAIQLGVYSTDGDHRAKGGSPDQWPADLDVIEWPETVCSAYKAPDNFSPLYRSEEWQKIKE